ncbi:response regulator [Paenibacillus sp. CAA11]|uniref:response regulator n=1 Tax=Paenibacillus sp. CAA11 TaxID=1532905 RepID=UPI000D34DAEE|nr:response regulator [Paenibacillus sp. CAA11]AWB45146.1 response regulator [Paenibacillus sp. CAA11]
MPNTATLQVDQRNRVYQEILHEIRQAGEVCGVLFLYAAQAPAHLEGRIKGILEAQSRLDYQIWNDPGTGTMALLFPGLALDAVHFQGLLLKQRLHEIFADLQPQMTLTSFPEQGGLSEAVLKRMAESARLSTSDEIHIFVEEEAESSRDQILIVDQDPTIREFLRIRMRMQGYDTYEADNGLSALELIEQLQPDLVLTELNLYGIDGLPYIHHIQKLDVEKTPKIVVLTEQRVEQTISQCFQSGVDDYITKPFSPVELDARIRRCFH